MRMNWMKWVTALLLVAGSAVSCAQTQPYRYFRLGNPTSRPTHPQPGFALMGGGTDLDAAFTFLCRRSGGGDFLVLRAAGDDEYNRYIQKLCPLNSVATIILPSRSAAEDPFVAKKIREAGAIFIAGGDQANYINFWMGTPVQAEMNAAIARGVPIGGTSAGLAVLGEFAYTSQGDKPDDPNLDGKTALADPFGPRITLVQGFLDIPILKGIITDTHFAKRNRMGRLLVFLARLNTAKPNAVRGIGVEERAAVLVEPDGHSTVVGHGCAYLVDIESAAPLEKAKPVAHAEFAVQKLSPGHSFEIKQARGDATHYTLSVDAGSIHSTQPGGAVY